MVVARSRVEAFCGANRDGDVNYQHTYFTALVHNHIEFSIRC